jgi:hypothetical protein
MSDFFVAATDGPAPYALDCTAFCAAETAGDSIASFTVAVVSGPGVLGTGPKAPSLQGSTTLIYWMDFSAAAAGTITVILLSVTTTSGHGPFHKTLTFTAR